MNRKGWFGLVVVAIGLMIGQARAGMIPIFSDSFTAADNTVLIARTPDVVNVPNVAYDGLYSINSYTNDTPRLTTVQGNQGRVGPDVGLALPISSYLSANPSNALFISATLDPNDLLSNSDTDPGHSRGLGLGFWVQSQPVRGDAGGDLGDHATDGFSGLRLGQDSSANGFLSLFIDGALIQADAYSGTWTQAAEHTLSYDVNVISGNIENVVLDGTSYTFPTVTGFSNPLNIGYVGFDGSGITGTESGFVDDFVVAVPEPASLGLLTIATGMTLFRRRC